MLIQPLNQVRDPEPEVPPRFHMEFQNCSSGCPSTVTPFWYSDTRTSRRGSKAAHHLSENSPWHRFRIRSSAFRRSSRQSSADPSMITDGNPHIVIHL